jgi:CRP/FNR family transcriptional regulator
MSLDDNELDRLDSIVKQGRPLTRGEHIFRTGDSFLGIYVVRAGAVKSYILSKDGEEQVTGFHLTGEIFGLDGIHSDYHNCSSMTLDTTTVCKIPIEHIEELARQIPNLQHHLLRLMSKEIMRDENFIQLLSKKAAEEKLAWFLYDLAERFDARGFASTEYHLPMSRTDIGNYLGLALETVSRQFHRFQNQGLLSVNRKNIIIHQLPKMRELAGLPTNTEADHPPSMTHVSSNANKDK